MASRMNSKSLRPSPTLDPASERSSSRRSGVVEVGLGIWTLSALAPLQCAIVQTLLLVALNAGGLLWARHIIHDPGGMVVKNFAFLVLVWVMAGLPSQA